MVTVLDLPVAERPREKMILHGATTLSDSELIAVLLGSGSREFPVLVLCRQLLARYHHDLSELSAATAEDLCTIKGIGTAKAAVITAAMELGRRSLRAQHRIPRIKSEADAVNLLTPYFQDGNTLKFMLVLLTKNFELLAVSELALREDLPDITHITRLVGESGAYRFGLVRNDSGMAPDFADNEAVFLINLDAAAGMLRLGYLGRLVITAGKGDQKQQAVPG
jgi:DNA repair protein RadC